MSAAVRPRPGEPKERADKETEPMTLTEYHRRDYRIRCTKCSRWMRSTPTKATPATRRPVPFASLCTDCPVPASLRRRAKQYKSAIDRAVRSKKGRT